MGQSVSCFSGEGPLLLTAASNGDAGQVRQVGGPVDRQMRKEAALFCNVVSPPVPAGAVAKPISCRIYAFAPSAQLPALCGRYDGVGHALPGLLYGPVLFLRTNRF